MNDLLIKGADDNVFRDGYDYYHVRMGEGFIDAIECGLSLKDYIENDARGEHGSRMLVNTKVSKRSVTLKFTIFGATKAAFMTNKKNFENMLYKGVVDVKVNDTNHPDIYHLVYTGKSVTYNHSYSGICGTIAMQFIEPDPSNRTQEGNTFVKVI